MTVCCALFTAVENWQHETFKYWEQKCYFIESCESFKPFLGVSVRQPFVE